jgi:hypothetical protein
MYVSLTHFPLPCAISSWFTSVQKSQDVTKLVGFGRANGLISA